MGEILFSESDCYKILSEKLKCDNFTILNFEHFSLGEVNGYLGVHSGLKITIKRNYTAETHNFFVKSLPQVQSQRDFVLEVNGFFKESQFFNKYNRQLREYSIDILEDAIAACFLTKEEDFVFEDLGPKGYKTLSSRAPLDIDCIKSGLTALSKLHASCLILEKKKSFRLIEEFEEELAETFYSEKTSMKNAWVSSKHGIKALIDTTHTEKMKISKDLFLEKVFQSFDQQKIFATPSTKFQNTICHGDPWTKNFMFKFEDGLPVNCIMVDFQTYRYSPPAQDVMAFLYLNAGKKMRDDFIEELLQFYYEELNQILAKFDLKNLISEEEFFDSCLYFKPFALLQTVTHFQIVLMSEETGSELIGNPEQMKFVMFENKYDFMVKTCQKDPVFRKMNFGAMEELRQFYQDQL